MFQLVIFTHEHGFFKIKFPTLKAAEEAEKTLCVQFNEGTIDRWIFNEAGEAVYFQDDIDGSDE